jgi:hypothetical protein
MSDKVSPTKEAADKGRERLVMFMQYHFGKSVKAPICIENCRGDAMHRPGGSDPPGFSIPTDDVNAPS